MAKIFEWDARKGSFVEGVSKTVMTPTAMTFNRTDKGLAALFNGSTSVLDSNVSGVIGTGDRTIEIWFRTKTSGLNSVALITDEQFIIRGSTANNLLITNNGSSGGSDYVTTLVNSIKLNTWHHLIVVRQSNGTITPYLDLANVFSSSSGSLTPVAGTNLTFGLIQKTKKHDGEISLVRVYDNLLSEKERENTYRDFLQSQITEKPVRGFELVKPTDLSYLKDTGLVAAYNMIPNGNTLVDISGNGLNFTIPSGINNTKDGLQFNDTSMGITHNSILDMDTFTVLTRIKGKPNMTETFPGLISKGTSSIGWRAYIDRANGRMRANVGNQLVSPPNEVNPLTNTFNTLAYVFKPGESISFWLNGVSLGSESITNTNHNTTDDLRIGSLQSGDYKFTGEIQDIRIYNRVLTEQEIKDYHNSFIKPVTLEDWSGSAVGDTI